MLHTIGKLALALAIAGGVAHAGQLARHEREAPRDGMLPGRWASGFKQVFGTSYEAYDSNLRYSGASRTAPISHVWFTAAQGVLTEVFWPTLDTPQVRDSQFMVTDGKTFFFAERGGSRSEATWLERGVPAFRIVNHDPEDRFSIERILYTDPDRDTVLQRIRFIARVDGLQLYLLHNPAVANSPYGDHGLVKSGRAREDGAGLFAWQADHAQAVAFSVPVKAASAAFSGPYDGYQDLSRDFRMDHHFQRASNGEVVSTAWLDVPDRSGTHEFVMALSFAHTREAALETALASLADRDEALERYKVQWREYQASVRGLDSAANDGGRLYRASVAEMKAMEDKTYEGSFVASPSYPWGERIVDTGDAGPSDRAHQKTGYHLVWPRDLYQMATAMMALDDYPSAIASLNRLRAVQYTARDGEWHYGFRRRSKDGSFPQNFWITGEDAWGGLQLDEAAMPVILAYRLWKAGKIRLVDYWDMVRRASDFVQAFGPWSPQERWEEIFGASPSTIASEITALWVASEMADAMGDFKRASLYRGTGDSWSSKPGDNISTWTFTTTGRYGNGRYFVRAEGCAFHDQVWNPDDETEVYLPNNSGKFREKDVVDGGFLELVRFGVRSPLDAAIMETIPVYDETIRVDIPGVGPGFRRYTHDRYNLDEETGVQTEGMLWPLLTGERGHYELAKALDGNLKPMQVDATVSSYVSTIERFATASLMLPEQVWDYGARAGTSTASATPLGWSHGEYVKLLRSRQDLQVFDRIRFVVDRGKALESLGWDHVRLIQ